MVGLANQLIELLANASAMTTAYVVALIVGGGMLIVSTVFGGHGDAAGGDGGFGGHVDADVTADVHHGPMEADHHPHSVVITKWFSMQFVVYCVAAFGLIGTVLSFASSMSSPGVLVWSSAGGLILGQGVHQALRVLRRTSGNTEVLAGDFLNQTARVVIAVEPSRRGEVAVFAKGQERYLPATAKRGDDRFKVGAQVVIVGIINGSAQVVSKEEYEFLTDGKSGGLQ